MKSAKFLLILSSFAIVTLTSASWAQILVEEGQGASTMPAPTAPAEEVQSAAPEKKTGEEAARRYFLERKPRATSMSSERKPSSAGGPRYLAAQFGTFLSDKQYRWGKKDDVGEVILGISYRVGQWTNSMDLLFRAEYQSFDIDGESPRKLSFLPVVTFPDVDSDFPLYFGLGAGLGVFLDQVDDESDLSFDYQAIAGLRLMDLWDGGGVVMETGLKGHVHLVSSGQFNGVFLSLGAAFTF